MPKVSVIIPCFNQGQYIDEAVNSVLSQTLQDFEIIIVNDGSTDGYTANKLNDFHKPGCKIIHTTNQGLASARNNGIHASSGKYILPLDSDDKIGPKYLEEAAGILDNEDKIGIVTCDTEFFGARSGPWRLPPYSLDRMLVMNMIHCCSMFRKSDFMETKGYDPQMKFGWEDWDLWLSLIEKGKSVYKLPEVFFYYRIREGNSMLTGLINNPEKRDYSLKTIYFNHLDFYMNKIGNPIDLYSRLNFILKSKDYATGRLIFGPLRRLKKLFKTSD